MMELSLSIYQVLGLGLTKTLGWGGKLKCRARTCFPPVLKLYRDAFGASATSEIDV
jgi:hypothetical protein